VIDMGKLLELACESWDDLRDNITKARKRLGADFEDLWFRGCPDHTYKLIPSLMRETNRLSDREHSQVEEDFFFEFQARAAELRLRGLTEWEYLFYSRHYGVPTRVLDWTDTSGVSLYFALENWEARSKGKECYPGIWITNPNKLNKKTWGVNDIVLPRYLGLDADEEYWDFGEMLAASGPWAWDGPVAIYPIQINDRVRAQRGWFTIHGNDRRALEEQVPHTVVKLVLKDDCIQAGLEFLRLGGFNRFTMYPDLDNLATWIREKKRQWIERRRTRKH
jgi:FRG domain